jgi:general secretion pathway protein A
VVLIVDEAQGLHPHVLEEIRLLSNLETSKSKLLQIILVGQPELDRTLSSPEFRQIRQRINMRYSLQPLSEGETREYIEKRLQVAGAKAPIFTNRAIEMVYQQSRGIPRLINILCDNALLNGFASEQTVIDQKLVRDAARDLKLRKKFQVGWGWILLGVLIVGGILTYVWLLETGKLGPLFAGFLQFLQPLKHFI